jgi:hypothetical protein
VRREGNGRLLLSILLAAGALAACRAEPVPEAGAEAQPPCHEPALRELVERFGGQLKTVSLLAHDTVTRREIRDAYASLVSPALLDSWISDPARAPGRQLSSPWPERIEIRTVDAIGPSECVVRGDVIHVTSVELPGESAGTTAVTLTIRRNGGLRISAYEAAEGVTPTRPSP